MGIAAANKTLPLFRGGKKGIPRSGVISKSIILLIGLHKETPEATKTSYSDISAPIISQLFLSACSVKQVSKIERY